MAEKPKSNWNGLFVALALIAGGAGLWHLWPALTGPPKMVVKQETSKTFFRMKANYTYTGRNGPEPLKFDIVAGCAIQITEYVFGASPGASTRLPTKYALPMSDGGAILIEVPRACGATTENGRVPADFLPAVVQYESSDDLSLGMLYASEDAYDSPLAKLKFHGATIEQATAEEFKDYINGDEFKKNLISIQSSKDLRGARDQVVFTEELKRNPQAVWKQRIASYCSGAMRLKVTDELRDYLRTLWKPGGPRYWYVDRQHNWDMFAWLGGIKASSGHERPFSHQKFNGRTFREYDLPFEKWGGGVLRRNGGGRIGGFSDIMQKPYNFPPEYYPLQNYSSAARIQSVGKNPEYIKGTSNNTVLTR